MIEAHHAVAFLRLAAIELRRIAAGDMDWKRADDDQLRTIAGKLDAEAVDLEAALAPQKKKAGDRGFSFAPKGNVE